MWSCAVQGAVCSVVVVERFEFAQGVPKVGLVHDGKHSEFPSAGLARRGTRGGFGQLKGSVGAIGG